MSGGIDAGGDPIALARISDVLIDFSSPKALVANLGAAVAAGKPIIIGTTGLDEDHHRAIDDAAHEPAGELIPELAELERGRGPVDWEEAK